MDKEYLILKRASDKLPNKVRSEYEIVYSDRSTDHGLWFRCILVRVSNVPFAQHQTEHGRIR
jgi:hypothetical protein